jgi:hypothetical protein
VAAGATLTFDSQTFARPRPVTLVAGRDLDATDDSAIFSVATPGVPPETLAVTVRDLNALALQVSARTLRIDEGASGTIAVSLSARPSVDVLVTVKGAAGAEDLSFDSGAGLVFTRANWATPQTVTVSARLDADGTDDQTSIEVASAGVPALTVDVTVRDLHVGVDAGPDAGADGTVSPPDPPVDAQGDGAPEVAPEGVREVGGEVAADARDGGADAVAMGEGSGCDCRLSAGRGAAGTGAMWLLFTAGALALARRQKQRTRR